MENNTKLIEQFSQLEKLCNDIYGDKHGVTLYIDEMKRKNVAGARYVSGWRSDLEALIDARHKRNCLSHGEVSFDTPYASDDDILFLASFKRRVLKQTDPLALLQKARTPRKTATYTSSAQPQKNTDLGATLLALFVILAGIIVVAALIFTNK